MGNLTRAGKTDKRQGMRAVKKALRYLIFGPPLALDKLFRRRPYKVYLIRIQGGYPEISPISPLRLLPRDKTDFYALTRRLQLAAEDSRIRVVVLVLGPNRMGLARSQEIGRLIHRLREKGKRTVAVLEGGGTREYLLASQCEQVVMVPSTSLFLTGLSFESFFLGELLDHCFVEPDFLSEGKYKNAVETLTRKDSSRHARRMMTELVQDLHNEVVEVIAGGRGATSGKVREWIDKGPYTPGRALRRGLVDQVAYLDEIMSKLRKEFGKGRVIPARRHHRRESARAWLRGKLDDRGQVAVLALSGPIVDSADGQGRVRISTRAVIHILKRLRRDASVKAVVLRISSPGGSALASDLIHRELTRLREKKPLIVSMGDVAASGGYYLAMAGLEVFVEGAAITGSIGVISGKLSLHRLYRRFGIRKELFSQGENAAILSDYARFSDSERKRMRELNRHFYKEFTAKVGQARKLSAKRVEEGAQGRVFSGRKALALGLADRLGGLGEAIFAAAKRAGLSPDRYPSVVFINHLRASWLNISPWALWALVPRTGGLLSLAEDLQLMDILPAGPAYLTPFGLKLEDTEPW